MARSRAGFTLIEMLIVMAVISMLLTVVLPVLWAARSMADSVTCQNNLKQLAQGMIAYSNDGSNDGRLPSNVNDYVAATPNDPPSSYRAMWVKPRLDSANNPFSSPWTLDKQVVAGKVAEYVEGNERVFICPTYKGQNDLGGSSVALHYAVPTILSGIVIGYARSSYYNDPLSSGNKVKLRGVPMVFEPMVRRNPDNSITNNLGAFAAGNPSAWTTLPDGAFEGSDRPATRRHIDKTNVAFQDAHVEAIRFPDENITAADIWIEIDRGPGVAPTSINMGGTNRMNDWLTK